MNIKLIIIYIIIHIIIYILMSYILMNYFIRYVNNIDIYFCMRVLRLNWDWLRRRISIIANVSNRLLHSINFIYEFMQFHHSSGERYLRTRVLNGCGCYRCFSSCKFATCYYVPLWNHTLRRDYKPSRAWHTTTWLGKPTISGITLYARVYFETFVITTRGWRAKMTFLW